MNDPLTGDPPRFEAALQGLERTVRELEAGDLDLDDALAAYGRGVRLLAHCQGLLDAAERQIALLTGVGDDGSAQTAPFDAKAGPGPGPDSGSSPEPAKTPCADRRSGRSRPEEAAPS